MNCVLRTSEICSSKRHQNLQSNSAGNQFVFDSNLGKDARYDQILHLPTAKKPFTDDGGTLDFFGSNARIKALFPDQNYTREQFSYDRFSCLGATQD